jgi:membrane protein required for colicin V production
MNWLDIVIIITLVMGVAGGLISGFIRSLLSFAGLVLGIYLAGRYYPAVADHLTFIHSQSSAHITAFALIFLAVILLFAILGFILRHLASAITLGWLDRLLGGLFGLFISAFVWGALLSIWIHYFPINVFKDSVLAQFLVARFPLALSLLPGSLQGVKDFFN